MHTGIFIHRVDVQGRIPIPRRAMEALSIGVKEPLEVRVEERMGKRVVILKKYQPGCVFCGAIEDCILFHEQRICRQCRIEL